MEDREFFDEIYSMWTKTTGASDTYWMPEEDGAGEDGVSRFGIYAVNQEEERKQIAEYVLDEDADFITAIHGCLPDLVRRLHAAVDESDRLDREKDELVCRVAELEMQADELNGIISSKEGHISDLQTKTGTDKWVM